MPRPRQSPLKLQSYKVNTTDLESKIHELDQLKSKLESSMSRQRQSQTDRIQELQDLRYENERLRKEIKQISLSNQAQHSLIQQLQQQLQQSQDLVDSLQEELDACQEQNNQYQNMEQQEEKTRAREMNEREMERERDRSREDERRRYGRQMEEEERRRQVRQMEQEHEIRMQATVHRVQEDLRIRSQPQIFTESKVVEVSHSRQLDKAFNQLSEQTISDSEGSRSQPTSTKKIKRLKRKEDSPQKESPMKEESQKEESPRRVVRNSIEPKDKYRISNSIAEREEDSVISAEDTYLQMIRLLYKQLGRIQIKARDLSKIPIIDSFAQLNLPSHNDVIRLLSNYPFQIREQNKINLIYDFIHREIERKGLAFTGDEIIWRIVLGVEEIQCERDGSLHSGMSAYLSESEAFSSHLGSTGFRRISKPAVSPIEERSPFEYNDPIEEGNSSVSSSAANY